MDVVFSMGIVGVVPTNNAIDSVLDAVLRMGRCRRQVQVEIEHFLEGSCLNSAILDING